MSDLSLNHDLYHEVHSQRHREAAQRRQARDLQHQARSARARMVAAPAGRIRLVAVLSPMVGLAVLVVSGVIG